MKYLMKCGHVADAHDKQGNPVCAICVGVTPDAKTVDRECGGTAGLEGRTAKCLYCGKTVPSKWELAFFQHKPNAPHDAYYCGCMGWD